MKNFKPVFISANRGDKGLERIAPRSIQRMMEKYAKAYGKPGMTVHKLRHSFATRNYDEHRDLLWLQEQLGHSDPKTTGLYAHILKDRKTEKVENM
ncbi:tyrosine-type recombinase/integrase [Aneurinibacillus tyrosinisolvens]|uniref:tyrosine-type recombinase/integrase n=1 Tax=Aneurinibacillus tyrosinisolvens TaxID=1443435 RepID=UPI00063EF6D7|nr:tyrosine-type recombinase/integrase [Aneurinibacillus tyrosinisolvens]